MPSTSSKLYQLALKQHQSGQTSQAIISYQKLLAINPNHTASLNNLGALLHEAGQTNEALKYFDHAIEITPNDAQTYYNKGYVFLQQQKSEQAAYFFRLAIKYNPRFSEAHNNLGMILRDNGVYDEALKHFNITLELQPDHVKSHYGKALILLLKGHYEEGFKEYEWRWQHEDSPPRKLPKPRWHGEPLTNKTILIHTEQGFGDAIQFVRYIPLLKQAGARVIVECKKPLIRLFTTAKGIDHLSIQGSRLPHYDCHCPMLSLPMLCKTQINTIPAEIPYLYAPYPKMHQIPKIKNTTLAIGFVWAGNPQHLNDHNRSATIKEMAYLFKAQDITFYSLQKGIRDFEIKPYLHHNVIDLSTKLNDYFDTADIINQMDIIITVDTSVAHLAGALGTTTWLILPHQPEWRWLETRTNSPWYPTMRLFRQSKNNDWRSVMIEIEQALRQHKKPILKIHHDQNCAQQVYQQFSQQFNINKSANPIQQLQQVLQFNPAHLPALNDLGALLASNKQTSSALSILKKVLTLQPDHLSAHINLSRLYQQQLEYKQALKHLTSATQLTPHDIEIQTEYAWMLLQNQKLKEAQIHYEKILSQQPQHLKAMGGYIYALLKSGQLEKGFALHDLWRWHPNTSPKPISAEKLWTGQPLKNTETLFIYTEGNTSPSDVIQFSRYFKLIIQQSDCKIMVACHQTLQPLLATTFTHIHFLSQSESIPAFNYAIPIMSLPRLFPNPIDQLPPPTPLNLSIIPTHITSNQVDIGLYCEEHDGTTLGDIPLSVFKTLNQNQAVTLHNLNAHTQYKLDKHHQWIKNHRLNNLQETANLIQDMDLIICEDSVVSHLAATMNKTTWLLLPYAADWRWFVQRNDSPWYPAITLFRQPQPNDWQSVLKTINKTLQTEYCA